MYTITFPPTTNGVTEEQVKDIINTGILNGTVYEINYAEVNTYADLPSADTKPNELIS